MPKSSKYFIGQKSGYLEITNFKTQYNEKYNRNRKYALCTCHKCENTNFIILPYNFKKQKSCGCDRVWNKPPSGIESNLYKGYNGISSKYITKAKERSKLKNLKFDITLKFLWKLYEKQNKKCAITGEDIHFGFNSKSNGATASIDRIDSKKGYTKKNVQWVHVEINYMKHKFSNKQFIQWCEKVCLYNKKNN